MWLPVFATFAVLATAAWYLHKPDRATYRTDALVLMLWGTTIMVFVDHVLGYAAEGGPFLDLSADAAALSGLLVLTVLGVWAVVIWLSRRAALSARAS